MTSQQERAELIISMKERGVLKMPAIEEAFRRVDRADFVPQEIRHCAYYDEALPIGRGQTISQPQTVAAVLELLCVEEGSRVFDVGSGSGWQSALLAYLVGETGHVCAYEIEPHLSAMGKEHLLRYPELERRITFVCGNARYGAPECVEKHGLFDRIVAAAEVREVPEAWRHELKDGGILVYPAAGSLWKEVKDGAHFRVEEHPGYAFVPFIEG